MTLETAPCSGDDRPVLIVGGAGYIGSVLTGHLLEAGWRVRSLDCLLYDNGAAVAPFIGHPRFEFVREDLTDRCAFTAVLEDVKDVVLLAGLVGDPVTKAYPEITRRINDDGHDAMLDELAGRGLDHVVFVSTCSNYGLVEGDQLTHETHELKPLSLYAQSKVRFEKRLLGVRGKVDFSPTVLRFATAFGLSGRMRFDLTINEFTRTLFRDEELLVYDAHTWRPYCHVRDFAEVIARLLAAPAADMAFEVFNAGGDANNFTKQMIVDAIMAEIPSGRVRYREHGGDPRSYRVNFAKIRDRLGFVPRFSVEDGIRELIAAMRQGFFDDVSVPESFYGNWVVRYPGAEETSAA